MVRVLLPCPLRKIAPAPAPGYKAESTSPPSVSISPTSSGSSATAEILPNSIGAGNSRSSAPGSSGTGSDVNSAREVKKQRKRRGKFKSEQLRKETCMTRSTGACIRCQKNKIRCIPGPDPAAWCMNCLSLSSRVLRMPCFRARVTEAELFRKGPTDDFAWTRRWLQNTSLTEIETWSSSIPHTIEVTQDLGCTLTLICKEYMPLSGDKQYYTWLDPTSIPQRLDMPTYAVADIAYAQASMGQYVDDNLEKYLEGYLDCENVIVFESFRIAMTMAGLDGSVMIRRALKLWVTSRLIETPWRICGPDTLGIQVCLDMDSPYYGRIPVTPIMDFQIDNIAIHCFLMPLRSKILKDLQKKILANRREDWLEIQLTLFILLNNVERQVKHDNWFARRYSLKERFSNYGLIENVFSGAKILLAHFHHVNRGYMPFSLNWDESSHRSFNLGNLNCGASGSAYPRVTGSSATNTKPPLELSPDQLRYMRLVTRAARLQEAKLTQIKEGGMYEEPMFWCSQLFLPNWSPPRTPSPQDNFIFGHFASI